MRLIRVAARASEIERNENVVPMPNPASNDDHHDDGMWPFASQRCFYLLIKYLTADDVCQQTKSLRIKLQTK